MGNGVMLADRVKENSLYLMISRILFIRLLAKMLIFDF
jgi:hypothetical protein